MSVACSPQLGMLQKAPGAASVFASLIIAAMLVPVLTFAQTVEQNPAPILSGVQRAGLPNPALAGSEDDTPFGVSLRQLIVVNTRADAGGGSPITGRGVDLSAAGPTLETSDLEARLLPFLERPLSQKLIFDIRAEITQYLRSTNRPLAAVTVPPQDISGGALRIEVLPFAVGEKQTEGNRWTPDSYLTDTIRVQPGEEVAADRLVADINWLNRNPYRNLGVVFEPGAKVGTTDLIIRSDEVKPWTVYGGYANSGADEDDQHRLFAGFNIANLPVIDQQISYQFTASTRSIKKGNVFDLDDNVGYLSHAISTFLPLAFSNGWRHTLSLQTSYTQSFSELGAPFTQDNRTFQLYGEYGVLLPDFGMVEPLLYGGIDFKRQWNDIFFSGAPASDNVIDVVQFIGGVKGQFDTSFVPGPAQGSRAGTGHGTFDFRMVASPGDVTGNNADARFVAASGNPNASAQYAYLYALIEHTLILPHRFGWTFAADAQLASDALPGLEKFAFGGPRSVRGYLTNEGSGDDGFSVRNQLDLPSFPLLAHVDASFDDVVAPYVYIDYGHSHDRFADTNDDLFSVGAGLDYGLAGHLNGSLIYGYALSDGSNTDEGDHRLYGSLTVRF